MIIRQVKNGRWHAEVMVIEDDINFRLSSNLSGCGSMIMHGWSNYYHEQYTPERIARVILQFLKVIECGGVLKPFVNNNKFFQKEENVMSSNLDIGSILTVVGSGSTKDVFFHALKLSGFTLLDEYPNPRHGLHYKQYLYGWRMK